MEKNEEMEKNEKKAFYLREVHRMLETGVYGEVTKTKTIALVGAGGAGGNSLQRMHRMGLKSMKNVETIAINSDETVLELLKDVNKRVLIGKNLFEHPKGAHGRTDIAKKMIDSARESLEVLITPYPILVIIGGLGGGTGSMLMVEMSKMGVEKGKLVIAIPIMPFSTETGRRALAKRVLKKLEMTGAVITPLDNDALLKDERMKGLSIEKAFETLDRIIFRKIEEVRDESMKTVIDEIARDIMEKISAIYEEPMLSPEMGSSYGTIPPGTEPITARESEHLMKAEDSKSPKDDAGPLHMENSPNLEN